MVCHNVEMEVTRKVANQSHNAMTSTRFCAPNNDVFQVIIKQRYCLNTKNNLINVNSIIIKLHGYVMAMSIAASTTTLTNATVTSQNARITFVSLFATTSKMTSVTRLVRSAMDMTIAVTEATRSAATAHALTDSHAKSHANALIQSEFATRFQIVVTARTRRIVRALRTSIHVLAESASTPLNCAMVSTIVHITMMKLIHHVVC